jgi:hypothetical protein
MPAMQGLLAGSPAALSENLKNSKDKENVKHIQKHAPALREAGFDFYKSLSGQFGVIFNRFYIHPADLQAADKAGKLLQVAPEWDKVDHMLSKSGEKHPVLSAPGPKAAFAAPMAQAAPQMNAQVPPAPLPKPASSGAQRKLMAARIANVQPGAPTSGPMPGTGRILNNILKPVV